MNTLKGVEEDNTPADRPPMPAGPPRGVATMSIVRWVLENYDPLPDQRRSHFPLVFYVRRASLYLPADGVLLKNSR